MQLPDDDFFGVIGEDFHILLEVENAGPDDIARGVAAALAVFEAANVDIRRAWRSSERMCLGWYDFLESGPDDSEIESWETDCRLADVWNDADEAAVVAATVSMPEGTMLHTMMRLDWTGWQNKLGTHYGGPHKVRGKVLFENRYLNSFNMLLGLPGQPSA